MSAQDETAAAAPPVVTVIPADEPLSPAAARQPEAEPASTTDPTGEAEAAADETTDEGQERDEKGRFKPRLQERFDELTREKHEARREADYWHGVAEASKPKPTEPAANAPAADPNKPKAENFETYDEFTEALTDWKIEQREQRRDAQQQAAAQATTWQQRAAEAKAAMPDFDEVMAASSAPMSHAMAEVLKESEHGPALAYHLAKNAAEAERIARLSPLAAARELGRIEATLSTPAAAPAPAPKKVTSAPTPPTPIGSGRSTTGDPANMSQADYMAWRQTQLKEMR